MGGVVADSVDKTTGKPTKYVLSMQRTSPRSFWKIHYLNRGLSPVPEVAPMIRRCVLEQETLTATFTYDDALSLASRRGRPVRLSEGEPGQRTPGPRRHSSSRGEPQDDWRKDPTQLSGPDPKPPLPQARLSTSPIP